jgi:hypothetical protein
MVLAASASIFPAREGSMSRLNSVLRGSLRRGGRVAGAVVFIFATVTSVQARVTAFFSAGTTCNGPPAVSFVANGPATRISLCVSTTTEALCGHTIKLRSKNIDQSGHFLVKAVAHGRSFADTTNEVTIPVAITNPPADADFGATVSSLPVAAGAKQLLATFELTPTSIARSGTYAIELSPVSSVAVSTRGTCAMPIDTAIFADITLRRCRGVSTHQ